MMQTYACARFEMLVHQVINVASTACCCTPKKHNSRDEIKISTGSARDSTTEFDRRVSDAVDDGESDGGPGSGDEDVLTSLGASYRAWRVYHREKNAHEYTKTRLVESIRRAAMLERQMACLSKSVEQTECTLMKLEDLDATMIIMDVTIPDAITTDKESDCQCPLCLHRIRKAEAYVLRWKMQCQQLQSELSRSRLEKTRLMEEHRKATKNAVLIMNRQYSQHDMLSSAPSSLSRTARYQKNEIMKRSYSDIAIARD